MLKLEIMGKRRYIIGNILIYIKMRAKLLFFLAGAIIASLVWAVFGVVVLLGQRPAASNNPTNVVDVNDLLGKKWYLQMVNGASSSSNAFVEFMADGKASGFAGCNNFVGSFTYKDDAITLGQIASTKMFCQNTNELETSFLKNLAEVSKFSIQNTRLILTTRSGELIFNENINIASDIIGLWAYTKTVDAGVEKARIADSTISVVFNAAGKISGESCNLFSGDFVIKQGAENLSVSNLVSTKKFCTNEGVMAQEDNFLKQLSGATKFEINALTMKIYVDNDTYMEFAKAVN